ncbi:unnamed protein product [Lampetra planeri]
MAEQDVSVALENLKHSVTLVLEQLKDGESSVAPREDFDMPEFWEKLEHCYKAVSQESTKLSLAFSRPPLPSAQDCRKLGEGMENAVLATVTVFYTLPKTYGLVLRKSTKEATMTVLGGVLHLVESIKCSPVQSLSQGQLTSTAGVWEACDHISRLPRDNVVAVLAVMQAALGIVRDALEEIEQAQDAGNSDPFGDVLADDIVGFRENQDTYWSERDRQLLAPCLGLIKASKACLHKVARTVKTHGSAGAAARQEERASQLDDLADLARLISPSVDDLAMAVYPPMNYAAIRLNAIKLASVLKNYLEVTKHTCAPRKSMPGFGSCCPPSTTTSTRCRPSPPTSKA